MGTSYKERDCVLITVSHGNELIKRPRGYPWLHSITTEQCTHTPHLFSNLGFQISKPPNLRLDDSAFILSGSNFGCVNYPSFQKLSPRYSQI